LIDGRATPGWLGGGRVPTTNVTFGFSRSRRSSVARSFSRSARWTARVLASCAALTWASATRRPYSLPAALSAALRRVSVRERSCAAA
jgi:hypothetical protein